MENEYIQITKREYVLNVIGFGTAIEIISSVTPFSISTWADSIAEHSNTVLKTMSEEEIEKVIQKCEDKKSETVVGKVEINHKEAINAENN